MIGAPAGACSALGRPSCVQRASLLETPGAAIMSTAMNFGSKSFQPRPPDKGSFPLDHFGERGRSGLPGRTGAALGRLVGAARPGRHWRLLAVRAGPLRLGSARPGPVPAQGLRPRPEGGRRTGLGPRNRGGDAESRPPVWGRRCVDRVLRGCEARGVKRVSRARAKDAPDRRKLRGNQGFGDRFMDGFFVCQHFTEKC